MSEAAQKLARSLEERLKDVPEEFVRDMLNLIEQRNHLAHTFFNEDKLTSRKGLREGIQELESFRKQCVLMTLVLAQAQNDAVLSVIEKVIDANREFEQHKSDLLRSYLEQFHRETPGKK